MPVTAEIVYTNAYLFITRALHYTGARGRDSCSFYRLPRTVYTVKSVQTLRYNFLITCAIRS